MNRKSTIISLAALASIACSQSAVADYVAAAVSRENAKLLVASETEPKLMMQGTGSGTAEARDTGYFKVAGTISGSQLGVASGNNGFFTNDTVLFENGSVLNLSDATPMQWNFSGNTISLEAMNDGDTATVNFKNTGLNVIRAMGDKSGLYIGKGITVNTDRLIIRANSPEKTGSEVIIDGTVNVTKDFGQNPADAYSGYYTFTVGATGTLEAGSVNLTQESVIGGSIISNGTVNVQAKTTFENGSKLSIAEGKSLAIIGTTLAIDSAISLQSSNGLRFAANKAGSLIVTKDFSAGMLSVSSDATATIEVAAETDLVFAGIQEMNGALDVTLADEARLIIISRDDTATNALEKITLNGQSGNLAWEEILYNGGTAYQLGLNIPEPAEWAAIFGAIALGLAVYRRRK